ncbi:PREDICTED: transmembrane emp24 domain-containing protein p24delta11 [Tarenaya hassleriana]|uniref:transmembrane emp24 domain-containing protein p24delta11 n=1 Tax=Tarenaya hassleriana TaxID=28532 RepID=UPI00053C28DF|nr:PREDICTED: transmembrane emp24 domain-containing protein p24delta11 [Tarenaya hassleriana]
MTSKSNLVGILMVMMMMPWRLVESMRFDLESGNTKCISEDIKANAMTVGTYSIVNPADGSPLPDSHKLSITVTSPKGLNHHHSDRVESGNFAFTADESGNYITCFVVAGFQPPVKLSVDFEWKSGFAAKDWTKIAKNGKINMMEVELRKLLDTIKAIHDEIFYLREREWEMQQLNRSTNSRMAVLSLLSILVTLSVAGLQLWHLKSFLQRKKLL